MRIDSYSLSFLPFLSFSFSRFLRGDMTNQVSKVVVYFEGELGGRMFSDPVTAVAEIYDLNRHELGGLIVKQQYALAAGIPTQEIAGLVAGLVGVSVDAAAAWLELIVEVEANKKQGLVRYDIGA
jgi:hypothetical protein